jgi:hypothetical protein
MNARHAVAALMFTAAASAFAQGRATPDHPQPIVSTLSRAQVIAETLEARRLGLIANGEQTVIPSAAQLERVRLAGQRAAAMALAAR